MERYPGFKVDANRSLCTLLLTRDQIKTSSDPWRWRTGSQTFGVDFLVLPILFWRGRKTLHNPIQFGVTAEEILRFVLRSPSVTVTLNTTG